MRGTRWHFATIALSCVILVFGLGACSRNTLGRGERVGVWELPLRFRWYWWVWLLAATPTLGPSLSWSCEAELFGKEGSVGVDVELFPQGLTQFLDYEKTLGEETFDTCLGLLLLDNERLVDSASIPGGAGEVRRWCRYLWAGEVPSGNVVVDVFLLGTDDQVVKVRVGWWDVAEPWSREEALAFLERVKRADR